MSEAPRNIRHALKSIIPNWLSEVPGLKVGFTVLFVIALFCDLLVEVMLEGLFAAWPGKGTSTALSLNGRSRGFVRGLGETDDAYALRLIAWLDTWPDAGADELLVRLIQGYLGNNLVVRLIDRRGRFTTIDANNDVTVEHDATWNFDATELPERTAWWSDFWVVVYVTDGRWATYTDLTDTLWLQNFGHTDRGGVGHTVDRHTPQDIKTLLGIFKGAHTYCEAIVFTDDTALFIPGALGATYPDGRWGHWSRLSAGVQIRARAIDSGAGSIRFWVPSAGG